MYSGTQYRKQKKIKEQMLICPFIFSGPDTELLICLSPQIALTTQNVIIAIYIYCVDEFFSSNAKCNKILLFYILANYDSEMEMK